MTTTAPLWNRHHSAKCPSRRPDVSGAACNCGTDAEGREPMAQMQAAQRALEVCIVCGGRSAYVIAEEGLCRACVVSADVHAEDCGTLRDGTLPSCTCGVRQRLRSL